MIRPSGGVGWREFVEMICPTGEAKYFCKWDSTQKCPTGKSPAANHSFVQLSWRGSARKIRSGEQSRGLPPRPRFAAAGGAANRMFGLWEPLMTEERREKTNGDEDVAGPRRMLNEKQVLEIVPVGRTTLYRMETGRFPRSTYISPNRRVWFADQIVAWQKAVDEFNPSRGRGKGRHRVVSG